VGADVKSVTDSPHRARHTPKAAGKTECVQHAPSTGERLDFTTVSRWSRKSRFLSAQNIGSKRMPFSEK